ncbi:unnamed protein product [Calypogeia fissa]
MLNGFRMDYKKSSIYHQMWRGVDHVRDWYLGGQRLSFHRIPALLERISQVDPNAIVDWSSIGEGNTFKRAFICPSATRSALRFCQPMVSLDACHTKKKKFPTQLFLATCLDGNGKVVILCWAVAPVENKDNWIWFLENLQISIDAIDSKCIPLISDRQKGLLPAVHHVFPQKIHGHCAHHLKANVQTNSGKGAAEYFLSAVYANTKKEFDDVLDSLVKEVSCGVSAAKYIREIDPALYTRYAFPLPRHGQVTSNPCEQANSGLLPIREYAPFKLLVELWFYMQTKIVNRQRKAIQCTDTYSTPALRRHDQNLRTFGQWQVYYDGHLQARVQTTDGGQMHLVTIGEDWSCTCRELQEMQWPCEHMMAFDDQSGRDFTQHFNPCWKVSSLRRCYEKTIPCFLDNDLDCSDWCCPPEIAVKKGRHRVVRIKSGGGQRKPTDLGEDIVVDSTGDLLVTYPIDDDPRMLEPLGRSSSRKRESKETKQRKRKPEGSTGNSVRCGKCGQVGHNKRTCKSDVANIAQGSQIQQSRSSGFGTKKHLGEDVYDREAPDVTPKEPEDAYYPNREEVYDTEPDDDEREAQLLSWQLGTTQEPSGPETMAYGLANFQLYVELAQETHQERVRETCT